MTPHHPAPFPTGTSLSVLVALFLSFSPPGAGGAPVPEDAVSPHFEPVAKHLDLGGTMFAYVDIDGDLESVASTLSDFIKTQGAPPEIADLNLVELLRTMGVSQVAAVGLSSYQRGDRFHNKAFLRIPGDREGFLKAFGGEPAPFLSQKIAPSNADLILEQDLDLKSIVETIRNVMISVGSKEALREMDRAMGQPVLGRVTVAEFLRRPPTKVTIIGRIDREKRLRIPDGPDVAEFDVLVALEGMSWILGELKSALPPDALAQLQIRGAGFEGLMVPKPAPAPFDAYRPLLYVADGDRTLYLATRKGFLDECLSADGAIAKSEDFKKATAGLPAEGNGFSYISPDVTAEMMYLIETAQPIGASELAIIQSFGGEMTADLEYGIAHVSSNMPDGILWASNSVSSHKSSAVSIAAVPLAIMASTAVPVFMKTTASARRVQNVNSAKQILMAMHIRALDTGGKFPDSIEAIDADYLSPDAVGQLQWRNPETDRLQPWKYFGSGLTSSTPARLMMLASPRPVDGNRIVGFVDGSVQVVSEEVFRELERKWADRRK